MPLSTRISSFFRKACHLLRPRRICAPGRRVSLAIELLEDRCTPTTAALVADIVPGFATSSISNLVNLNGTLLFTANDGANGVELWKSDGTAAGTVLVKDINPLGDSTPSNLTNVNGTLFFSATDDVGDTELWKSDGTSGGTVLVKNISLAGSSSPQNLANVNGTLFFAAADGSAGPELWKSDGTTSGTVLIKDIHTTGSSNPSELTNVNGTLFFSADDGSADARELWKSDGTPLGTTLVKNINPTSNVGSSPGALTNVNGTLFFRADDGTTGIELWKSDGTPGGTVRVKDINPAGDASVDYLVNVNGTVFFVATDGSSGAELYKSDGTAAGTMRVKDINTAGDSTPTSLTSVNGTLYFAADDGATGIELWRTDGTDVGTVRVKDINSFGSSTPTFLTNVNGTLFFAADDGSAGRELWQSNGAELGTVRVKDINVSSSSSNPDMLTNVNGTLFFMADDGSHGIELWKATRFSDDFNRADDTVLGPDWFEGPGNFAVYDQKLLGVAVNNFAIANRPALADMRVQARVSILTTESSFARLRARYSNLSNVYDAAFKNTGGVYTAEIHKTVAGVPTRLSSKVVTPLFDDSDPEFTGFASGRMQFDVVGNSLKLYFNGVLVGNVIDSSLKSAGSAGVFCDDGVIYDNFSVSPLESSLPFGDNFERATSTNLGSQWAEKVSDFAVANNTLVAVGRFTSLAVYQGASEKDVCVQAKVTVLPFGFSNAAVGARYSGPGNQNYYAGVLKGQNGAFVAVIVRNINGSETQLTTPINVGVRTGVLRLEVIGSSLKLYFNGALVGRAVDTMLAGPGLVGIGGTSRTTFDTFNVNRIFPTIAYDGFNRSNAADLGAKWKTVAGTAGIASNKATTTAVGATLGLAVRDAVSLAKVNVEATVTVLTAGVSEAQLVARYVSATTYYYAALERSAAGSYSVSLWKVVAGVKTRLSTSVLGSSPGFETATLRFELNGTSLRVLRNGVLTLTATDSSILAAGMAGIRGTSGATFEDFTMA